MSQALTRMHPCDDRARCGTSWHPEGTTCPSAEASSARNAAGIKRLHHPSSSGPFGVVYFRTESRRDALAMDAMIRGMDAFHRVMFVEAQEQVGLSMGIDRTAPGTRPSMVTDGSISAGIVVDLRFADGDCARVYQCDDDHPDSRAGHRYAGNTPIIASFDGCTASISPVRVIDVKARDFDSSAELIASPDNWVIECDSAALDERLYMTVTAIRLALAERLMFERTGASSAI